MNKEQMEFVAMVAQEYSTLNPYQVGCLAKRLMGFARKAERNAVNLCNVADYKDQRDGIKKGLDNLLDEYQMKSCAGFKVGGDPRGYTLKMILPSGKYNTFGGKEDGWGVPC